MDPSPVDVAASSPRGRILPSLVPDGSLLLRSEKFALTTAKSEPPSRAPKRPSVQTLKGRDQASKSPRNSDFRLTRTRRWRRDCRPRRVTRPACNQTTGQASPGVATTAPSPVVGDPRSCAGRKARRSDKLAISCDDDRAKRWPNDQRSARETDSRPRILRGLTIDHLKVESEPSWLATSSAMNSNPASVGSGDCSPRDEAPLHALHLLVDPDPSRREPSRSALTF